MGTTFYMLMGMLAVAMLVPFIALYAIWRARQKDYATHIRIQTWLFWTCMLGVVILEVQIRIAGGSGSLVANGTYARAPFFKPLMAAHIVGSVLTYVIWALQLIMASRRKSTIAAWTPRYLAMHKRLGCVTIAGLFYTAITAFVVCTFAFFL